MINFSRSILDYWQKTFSEGDVIANGAAMSITVNAALSNQRRAMMLEYADGYTRATITPAIADRLAIHKARNISAGKLRNQLTEIGAALHDPDFIFYLPDGKPLDRIGGRVRQCRRLGEADREAFNIFQATASKQDMEDAYVELDHLAAFGMFEGDRLVCAASTYTWGGASIADLGVLTLPEFRGRGHACAVVQTISQFAREQGFEPQYRCQLDNEASIALAKASGFVLFGKWEVNAGPFETGDS